MRELNPTTTMLPNCIMLIDVDTFDLQIVAGQNGIPQDDEEPRIVADTWDKITSLNHAAKAFGVGRNENLESAVAKCPTLRVLRFPVLKTGKPDYKSRRTLTQNIIQCIKEEFPTATVEMSSCDEFYVDLTSEVHSRVARKLLPDYDRLWPRTLYKGSKTISGFDLSTFTLSDLVLLHGAVLASDLMHKVLKDLKIRTSVGIGYNKLVAKLGCGVGKPAGLTIVSEDGGFQKISTNIPLTAVPRLGGKAGETLAKTFRTMDSLSKATVEEIVEASAGKVTKQQATNFLSTCQGICTATVIQTTYHNNITVAKQFREGSTLTKVDLQADLEGLCEELMTRIEEEIDWNGRRALSATVSIKLENQSTEGVRILDVASLSPKEILAEVWTQFKYSHCQTFQMNRIELTVKKFELLNTI